MFDILTVTLTLPIYVADAIFSSLYGAAFLKPRYNAYCRFRELRAAPGMKQVISKNIKLPSSEDDELKGSGLLRPKHSGRLMLILWIIIYLSSEAVLYKLAETQTVMLRTMLDLALLGILELIFFEQDFKRQMFAAISFTAGKELIRNIGSVGYYLISHATWSMFESMVLQSENLTMEKADMFLNIYLFVQSLVSVAIYVGLMFTYLKVLSGKYIHKGYEPSLRESVFLILPCITGLGVSMTLRVIILKINERLSLLIYDKVPEVLIWIIVICFLLLGSIIAAMMLFQYLIERNEERRKQAILEKQVEQLHREIEDVENIYSDLRGLKHDMRNHLNNIMQYVKNTGNDMSEIDGYIGELEDSVNKLDFSSKSGNPITDIILYQRMQEAKRSGITFEVDFVAPDLGNIKTDYVTPGSGQIEAGFVAPNSGRIDIYDIAVILDNALDNAFEACRKVEGAREISLKSYMKGTLYFIEIENVFDGQVTFDKDTGLPVTSKADKHLHGIGMSNIQKCARKYMGDIDIEIKSERESHRFILTVMMNTRCAR
ncbi:sensor histidine kinase [Oribacterium sp. NK2B42]|uniref:sensor histidine kinase n=1 Tax=Oribacterium sp. NK2B42 TaxID=689781 RepID=UPI0004096B32|nr:GHKL domain-containing protein [Oribacterium sp. NK2B42]